MENVYWNKECKRKYSEYKRIDSEIRKLDKAKKELGSYYILDVLADNISKLLNMPYRIDDGNRIHFYKEGTTKREMKYTRSKYTISFSGVNRYDYQSKKIQYYNIKKHKWEPLPESIDDIVNLIINKETDWEPKGD